MKTKGDCEVPPLPQPPNEFCQGIPDVNQLPETDIVKLREVPDISTETAHVLLKKSAASILCHVGFNTAMSDSLDTLSEKLQEFLQKFCLSLREQQNSILLGQKVSYTDAFEATLYEHEIRGYEEFIKFSKSLTVKYVQKLEGKRKRLECEYEVLASSLNNSARSLPGHTKDCFAVDLLKGNFESDPVESQPENVEHSEAISRSDVFMHESNGIYFP